MTDEEKRAKDKLIENANWILDWLNSLNPSEIPNGRMIIKKCQNGGKNDG